ncbi:hypothetical protein C0J52_08060 [Blattella germanica]|nr:hypothetical protein C0J52_08060 [Blattella germanica]
MNNFQSCILLILTTKIVCETSKDEDVNGVKISNIDTSTSLFPELNTRLTEPLEEDLDGYDRDTGEDYYYFGDINNSDEDYAKSNLRKPVTEVTLNLPQYLQKDDVETRYYLAPSNDTTDCTRECVKNDVRVCYYHFEVENYAILTAACGNCINNHADCDLPQCISADGFEKGLISINRMLPGPSIQVCYGDTIIVDVRNRMLGTSLAIHWHGIIQKNNNYMDGVPFVTQCPVQSYSTYRYAFNADTIGTHYWHSHSGVQKLNGFQGSLIIRQPKFEDPNGNLYDFDLPAHILFIMDWHHAEAEARTPGLIRREPTQDTTFYLINGKGRFTYKNGTRTTTPYREFHVTAGWRYRFRVVSAVCTQCPARLNIEGHSMLITASDGNPINPVRVDSLEIYSGKYRALLGIFYRERYDFILEANQKIGSYWIQVRGMHHCFEKDVCQTAILKYKGSTQTEPLTPFPSLDRFSFTGLILNPQNASCGAKQNAICVSQLSAKKKIDKNLLIAEPDHNIEITFGFQRSYVSKEFQEGEYNRYLQTAPDRTVLLWINGIQLRSPTSPLLTQYKDNEKDIFCPNGTDGNPTCPYHPGDICSCVSIFRVRLGSIVQLVLIDKSFEKGLNHPFHLHGAVFNVLSMGYLPKKLMNAKDINELLKRNDLPVSTAPVFKDTIAVPSAGFVVLRFRADNPGYWFFHCHFVFHHATGMATIIQVGEQSEFPELPDNLPKCGDYLPPVTIAVESKRPTPTNYHQSHERPKV